MIVEKKKFTDNKVVSLGEVRAMKFDDGSESEIFDILTDGLYSDPIGSIVREITSNCFDAHVEAGNDTTTNPVLVRLTKEVSGNFISFIDNGIGMTPDRVYNVYGTYLKSTKNTTNDQIGGFGLGGKTPLTYNSRSFFLVTRKDGIKYTYNIFEGEDSPEIELMSQESTKEGNGTEVKVPVLELDIWEFEQNVLRQLYYFENIVFEGFSDRYVSNDYTIIKGDKFLYRGDTYDSYMHVCLGKVAYPIAYETLGLEKSEYRVPVAVKLEIGELDGTGVTRSREQLKYTPKNREIIKKKMEAVKKELSDLLGKQMDNVQTVEQYYEAMNNYSMLRLTDEVSLDLSNIVKNSDLSLPNFKYNDVKMPSSSELIPMFYNIKRYGKKETRRSSSYTNKSINAIKNRERGDIVHTTGEFKRVVLKQSYLQYQYQRFYLHTPKDFTNEVNMGELKKTLGLTEIENYKVKPKNTDVDSMGILIDDGTRTRIKNLIPKKKADKLVADLIDEVKGIMSKYAVDYDELVVPDSYKELRKAERISDDILKDNINAKLISSGWYNNRIKIQFNEFVDFKGTIYYGFRDDEYDLKNAAKIASGISGDSALCSTYYNSYRKDKFRGMMFAQIAKNSEKYFKLLGKKAIHVKYFYQTYLSRKIEKIVQSNEKVNIKTMFNNKVHEFFKDDSFNLIDKDIASKVETVKEGIEELGSNHIETYHIDDIEFKNIFGFKLSEVKLNFKYQDELNELIKLTDNNEDKLRYLNYPSQLNVENEAHRHFIELVNLSIDK